MTEKSGINNERYGKVRRNGALQQGHGKTLTAGGAFVGNNLSKQCCLRHYSLALQSFLPTKATRECCLFTQHLYLRALPLQVEAALAADVISG